MYVNAQGDVVQEKVFTENVIQDMLYRKGCTGNAVQKNVVQEMLYKEMLLYRKYRCVMIIGYQYENSTSRVHNTHF